MVRDTVTLKGMRFHALIGVLPHEEHVAQPVEVDVVVEVAPVRSVSIVDYARMYAAVNEVMTAAHIRYLEDAAESVATQVLEIEGVAVVHVAIRKPHVALAGPLAYAQVCITRAQGGVSADASGLRSSPHV